MSLENLLTLDNKSLFKMTICRVGGAISTELDGEVVVLNIASGIYSRLDNVGAFIWNQLERPKSIGNIRDAVLEKYDVNEEQCIFDLLIFLKELVRNGLIKKTTEND